MAAYQNNMSHREVQEQKYKAARANLLMAIIFTILNIVMYMVGSETMLLFSISIPYFVVVLSSLFGIQSLLAAGCVVAFVIVAAYFVCWLMSKKHYGWLIGALVLFGVDILAMVGLYVLAGEISGILDVVFHCWVLYYLILGVSAGSKLKTMPVEVPVAPVAPVAEETPAPNSAPLRRVGEDEKFRVLLEHTYGSYRVVYRRVKRTNQLVINDYIYDEVEMLVETAHCLSARINGQLFEVGFDGVSSSYFNVDGQRIAKKLRLY